MNDPKLHHELRLFSKNLLLVFSLFILLITFQGCDLFGDEEHCQYETVESKIWLQGQHPAFYKFRIDENFFGHQEIFFEFNHSSNPFESNFHISNSCPYGAIGINIKIKEKGLGAENVHSYYGHIYELKNIGGKKIYNHVQGISFRKISENEYISYDWLTNDKIKIELNGFLENGPKNFYITLYAVIFGPNPISYHPEYETWANENIEKIEFTSNFVKWD